MELEAPGDANVLTDDLLNRAKALSSATLHEASGRTGALPSGIKPVHRSMTLVGRALPVRSPAGDNLWIHRAMAVAKRGDILVVDVGEGVEFGYFGDIMATSAIALGIAGLVITGGVRDSQRLIELGLPVFSRGIAIRGTGKDLDGDGAVGEPIRIGEIVVRKGDLVFGDADGVVVFSAERAAGIVESSESRDAKEAAILEKVGAGELTIDVYKL